MSLFEELDDIRLPYRCLYNKAHSPSEWHEMYNWLDFTCGEVNWQIDIYNTFCFAKEEYLIMFKLRWL